MIQECKVCGEKVDNRWLVLFEVHQLGGRPSEALVKIYIDDTIGGTRVFAMDNIDYMKTQLEKLDSFSIRMTTTQFYLCDVCKDGVIKKLTEKKPGELAVAVKLLEKGGKQ